MSLRLAIVILGSVLIFRVAAAAGQSATCPANVDVHEQLSTPLEGWSATYDNAPHQLAGITFYDGPPKENASLVYDDIAKSAGKQIARWHFAPASIRPIWIACRYAATAVVLTKALPATVSGCTVTYDPKQQVAGEPVIENISCK
jgi:hypothetical protein